VKSVGRDDIIAGLSAALEPLPYIRAFWLEGADANGAADEYSDIDCWVDFDDPYEEQAIAAVEAALKTVVDVDSAYIFNHGHPKIRQRVYHLAGSPEFLMIDFCWQLHSRLADGEGVYVKGDKIESAKVIFDKAGVIRYKDYDAADFAEWNAKRLEEARYRYSQHCRVQKYVLRGQYAESCAYYNRYVAEPLVDLLRLIYTPAHADYGLVHISRHIPRHELEKLEYFLRISSLDEIAAKTKEAEIWFLELSERVTDKFMKGTNNPCKATPAPKKSPSGALTAISAPDSHA